MRNRVIWRSVWLNKVELHFKTQCIDSIGRVLSLPSVIFDFDCSPYGTLLNFSVLFVVAVVAADVVAVGVFFPCAVTVVAVVKLVAVLVLGYFFCLLLISCKVPPPHFTFFD